MINARKLVLPLFVALACVAAGTSVLPAGAATKEPSHHADPKGMTLRVDSIKVAGKAGPLVVRVAADGQSRVSITVNGRRVKTPFEFAGPRAQAIELRALGDGLRAGANKLRITSIRKGVVKKATRTVTVPGWALLADAGEDTGTLRHVNARLGTAPLPGAGQDGAEVDYTWRIARRPKGAKAGIADADGARPVLKTRRPGTYVLQLGADPEANDDPTSFDQVTVAVAPNDPPIGVPIDTQGDNHAIVIAGQGYGGGAGEGTAFVVLERTTRAVVASGRVGADADGMKQLTDLADNFGGGANYMRYSMIVGSTGLKQEALLDPLFTLLKKLGAALASPEELRSLKAGAAFSVIGIPGAPAGAATTRVPSGAETAAITGYLQPNQATDADGTPLYDFAAGEQPSFDTKVKGDATGSEMVIAGQSYPGALPAGTTAGFHVVVLDSLTLELLKDEVLATNGTSNDRAAQGAVAGELAKGVATRGGPLIFVQTIGKPSAAGPEWQGVVKALVRVGANPELVNALNGTAEYALVGRVGSSAPPAEASTAYDHGPYAAPSYPPSRLVGTLARGRTSSYVPNVYSTPTDKAPEGSVNLALTRIAYQPAQAWPPLPGGTADEAAKAEHLICEGMKFCQSTDSCPSVRDCFWQRYSADWELKLQLLNNVAYPGDGKGFGKATFDAVKKELFDETADVVNVKHFLVQLQEPFEKSALSSYVDLQGISKNIYDSVQPPPQDNSKSWTLGLIGKIVALGGAIPPPVRYAAAGISAAFSLASYLSDKSGQPILGAEITARSAELGNELVSRVDTARRTMVGLGMMLVSDYGKLTASDQHVDTDWALPADIKAAVDAYRTSAKQWFYEALIPTEFPFLISAKNANNARYLQCLGGSEWPNQPDMFQMNATVGYDDKGNAINAVFFFTKGSGGGSSPSDSIGDEMFRPRSGEKPGLGIEKLQFFSPRVFGGAVFHARNTLAGSGLSWLPRS
jgi:hypothetical protein